MHQWALKGLYLLIRKIENIQVHVKKGCLSGIQPGRGTNRNENLHQDLNKNYVVFKVWSWMVILFNHERMAATSEKRSKHPIEHYCKSHQHAPTNKRFGVLKRMNRLSANLFRLLFWRRYLHRLYHCFLLTNQWSVSQTAHIRLDQIPFMQSTSSDFFNSIMFFAKRKTKCGWRAFKSTTKIMESIWKKGCSWWELPLLFNGIQP